MKKFDIVTLNISSSLKFNEINLSPSWAKGGGEQHKNICCYFHSKGLFFYETRQKIFRLLGGKIKFELALQPSTASTAKIQILFSRQGV